MKIVTCIIQPHQFDEVKEGLQSLGVQGMTVTEVNGYGRQKGHKEIYRGQEYTVAFSPKTKIEIAVEDAQVPQIIEVVSERARTGSIGDGKIFVTPLEQVVRIRTGEEGHEAL